MFARSTMLAYLAEADRARFTEAMAALRLQGRGHWISNEAPTIIPGVTASSGRPKASGVSSAPFLLALDGNPVAWTHGHGRALRWI